MLRTIWDRWRRKFLGSTHSPRARPPSYSSSRGISAWAFYSPRDQIASRSRRARTRALLAQLFDLDDKNAAGVGTLITAIL